MKIEVYVRATGTDWALATVEHGHLFRTRHLGEFGRALVRRHLGLDSAATVAFRYV